MGFLGNATEQNADPCPAVLYKASTYNIIDSLRPVEGEMLTLFKVALDRLLDQATANARGVHQMLVGYIGRKKNSPPMKGAILRVETGPVPLSSSRSMVTLLCT
jgi:hypothetical protein